MPTALLCIQGGAREQSHDPEETDALDALGSLADFAGCAATGPLHTGSFYSAAMRDIAWRCSSCTHLQPAYGQIKAAQRNLGHEVSVNP